MSTGPIVVTAGGATRLVDAAAFHQRAERRAVGQQPVVQVVDGTGNPVAGNRNITVAIGDGAGALRAT